MGKRMTIALGVVAALLFTFIMLFERDSISSGQIEEREGRLLSHFVRDRVERLTIEHEGATLELVRERDEEDELGEWKLVRPLEAPADQDAVSALIGALDWADAVRSIEGIAEADRKRFGLLEPAVRLAFSVGNETHALLLGKEDPTEGGFYAALDEGDWAFVVRKDVRDELVHDAAHFRAKELFKDVSPTQGDKVELEGEAGRRVLEKKDGSFWLREPVVARADEARADEVLRALEDLRAVRFVDDAGAAGLGNPFMRVSWSRLSGEEPQKASLVVGVPCAPGEGTDAGGAVLRHAQVNDGPIACVEEADLTALGRDADALVQKQLVTVDPEGVTQVTVEADGRTLTVTQKDGTFVYAEGGKGEPSTDAVRAWVRALRDARASAWVPREGDGTPPAATLTLTEGERTETLSFVRADGVAARVRRDREAVDLEVRPEVPQLFLADPVLFRDRQLIAEEDDSMTGLEVARGAEVEAYRRGEGEATEPWVAVADGQTGPDAVAVRDAVRRMASLRAAGFVAARARPEHGLGAPRAVVTAHFAADEDAGISDASRTRVLRIGGEAPTGGAYARLDDDPAVFVVDADLVSRFTKSLRAP